MSLETVSTEWGVRRSNGTVQSCRDRAHANALVRWSVGYGCIPTWQLVSREVPEWSTYAAEKAEEGRR